MGDTRLPSGTILTPGLDWGTENLLSDKIHFKLDCPIPGRVTKYDCKLSRGAFSLLELIVCMGIIGLLTTLAISAIGAAKNASLNVDCKNNQHQLGLALFGYEGVQGHFPKTVMTLSTRTKGEKSIPPLGWQVQILPFMGRDNEFRIAEDACKLESDLFATPPHSVLNTKVPEYLCKAIPSTSPASPWGVEFSLTGYLGVGGRPGKQGIFTATGTRLNQISDGASNTLGVGERPPPHNLLAGTWYPGYFMYDGIGPNNLLLMQGDLVYWSNPCKPPMNAFGPGKILNECDRFKFWSLHPGGGNFLIADGSVRFYRFSDYPILVAMSTREGNETVHDH